MFKFYTEKKKIEYFCRRMKLVIFDLDGTLLNTIADLAASANFALRQQRLPEHTEEEYKGFVGNGIEKLLERALGESHCDAKTLKRTLALFKSHYDAHCTDLTQAYPGILELLEELQSSNVKLAVASNKYQKATSAIIDELFPSIDFSAVHGNRDGVPRKPDPTIVDNIIHDVFPGGRSTHSIYCVGDSGTDIDTAAAAHITSIAVTWGFRSIEEIQEHHPDHIIETPEELLKFL